MLGVGIGYQYEINQKQTFYFGYRYDKYFETKRSDRIRTYSQDVEEEDAKGGVDYKIVDSSTMKSDESFISFGMKFVYE